MTFDVANSLDQDQDHQEVGPDLDPNHLTLLIVFLEDFFLNLIFKKIPQMTTKSWKITQNAKG